MYPHLFLNLYAILTSFSHDPRLHVSLWHSGGRQKGLSRREENVLQGFRQQRRGHVHPGYGVRVLGGVVIGEMSLV